MREFGLSAAGLGLLSGIYFFAFALFQLPLGVLLDRYGPRRVNATLLLVAASGGLWFALAGSAVELTLARANAIMNQCFFFDINGVGEGGVGRSIIVGPSGDVLHQAGSGPEAIPVEIDLSRVRREREMGIKGLGQVLKSFRDRAVDFPVYHRSSHAEAYLRTLGPLVKPGRNGT